MAISLAKIIIACLLADWAFKRLRMPSLIGLLIASPSALGLIDPVLMDLGAGLHMMALIVILLRASLELSSESLNKVGGQGHTHHDAGRGQH